MIAEPKKGLGKGLAALLGDETQDYAALDKARGGGKTVPTGSIRPGKFQPRQDFSKEAIESLAQSIREKGVLQPLLVRRDPSSPNQYELIAGERRWRAAQLAQLHDVPVVIRDMTDRDALEIGLIENLQRQDLNPVEEALAYKRLIEEFDRTQEDVAKNIGKSRSHIANTVRLLDLPQSVQKYLRDGKLSAGHARLLVGVEGAEKMAAEMVEKSLSVRAAESLAASAKPRTAGKIVSLAERGKFNPAGTANSNRPGETGPNADTRALEKQLSEMLGMQVEIKFQGKTGSLTVHYKNLDQLDEVLKRLGKR